MGLFSSDNNSHYNSLRLNLEKRFSKGFTILANYTHSRVLDDLSANGSNGRTDPFNRRFDYGVSNDDVPNVVNFSGVWQIPNAPLHGLASKLVNGWELTAIANWRSGFPYSIFSNQDNSFSGVLVIAFRGSQRCGELFDFGALRGVAFHLVCCRDPPSLGDVLERS